VSFVDLVIHHLSGLSSQIASQLPLREGFL